MPEPQVTFGPFAFDKATGTLWRARERLPMGGRATAVLATLLAADGEVVSRAALIDAAWSSAAVEENNLSVQIGSLRKVLGLREDGQEWIVTVARVGYRLVRDPPPAISSRPSLAVLPFANLSGNPDHDHIADGMVEDLTTAFSRFKNIGVVARQSAYVYKDRQFDIRDAARSLGVRYLLEGSVRLSGDRVRVTAQLIDGKRGQHIWAENLDGPFGDIFAFQDRITSGVVGLIEPEIRKSEIARAQRKHPDNLDANDLYWRGLALVQTADRHRHNRAVELLDRAALLDPDYGPILSMAAYAHIKREAVAGVDDVAIAASLCERALEVDGSDAFALIVASMVELDKGNAEKGLAIAKRAYALNPNSFLICNITGYLHLTQGNYDETINCSMEALRLTPGAPERFWAMIGMARAHLAAGRFDEAVLWSLRSLDANAEQDEVRPVLVAAYALLGQMEDAQIAFAELVKRDARTSISGLISAFEGPHQEQLLKGLTLVGNTRRISAEQLSISTTE